MTTETFSSRADANTNSDTKANVNGSVGTKAEADASQALETPMRAAQVIEGRNLASPTTPVLLMVSGGSDSTALAYAARQLADDGAIGEIAMLHVNHKLRGQDAEDDAGFTAELAQLLDIPLFTCEIDIAREAARTGDNIEALARHERYLAANEALESLCRHACMPVSEGRIFTAHTADDRAESFYMRSIVGTGPGGFRAMRYRNGPVVRPLLEESRQSLRAYVIAREQTGAPVARDDAGRLWREDATNAHTDRFRAYVRHEILPRVKEWNPAVLDVLTRTMNLIADEDDMLDRMAAQTAERHIQWVAEDDTWGIDLTEGFVVAPEAGNVERPLMRRVVRGQLQSMLGADARIDASSVEAVLDGFADGKPRSGYVANIQGDLAVSANKRGVRVEPMAYFRARRKKG